MQLVMAGDINSGNWKVCYKILNSLGINASKSLDIKKLCHYICEDLEYE